jgi:hypothetical protein
MTQGIFPTHSIESFILGCGIEVFIQLTAKAKDSERMIGCYEARTEKGFVQGWLYYPAATFHVCLISELLPVCQSYFCAWAACYTRDQVSDG